MSKITLFSDNGVRTTVRTFADTDAGIAEAVTYTQSELSYPDTPWAKFQLEFDGNIVIPPSTYAEQDERSFDFVANRMIDDLGDKAVLRAAVKKNGAEVEKLMAVIYGPEAAAQAHADAKRLLGRASTLAEKTAGLTIDRAKVLRDHLEAARRVVDDTLWSLDEGLSAVRKAEAGYRNPDPETGRQVEFEGISSIELVGRIARAEGLVSRLETIGF
jgi:hypothetical protein